MNELLQYFYQLVVGKRLAHAYLFTGDDYGGKQLVTQEVIKALGCLRLSEAGEPCHQCDICLRAEANQLADIAYIKPEGQTLKVDQIRQLKDWLTSSPLELSFKVAVIEQAETMNPSSSNAMLTFLEEPSANVYLILYAQAANSVLPTIQSRTQLIHFQSASHEERLPEILQHEVEPAHAEVIAILASDSTPHLIENYNAEEMSKWLKALNYLFEQLVNKNQLAFITVQTQLKAYLSVQQSLDSLDYLLALNHSALKLLSNTQAEESFQHYYLRNLLNSNKVLIADLLMLYDLLLATKEKIQANVSPQLAFEQLTIKASKI